jgi:Ca-activated chloride channel family protein
MRCSGTARAIVYGLGVSVAALHAGGPQQRPAFRSQAETVSVYATVRDRAGRLVSDLPRAAFQVFDNGKPVELTVFSSEIQPITAVLLLDVSGSMFMHFTRVRESAFSFIDGLLPHDRLRLGSFAIEVAISPILTNDPTLLRQIAREEIWPDEYEGGTKIWRALFEGLESLSTQPGRRVLCLVTDGADTGPWPWPDQRADVRRRILREDFMLYAVGFQQPGLDRALTSLAEDSGGGHHRIATGDDLGTTFEQITEELRRQYVLGFTPVALDGREHRIEVRLADPGMTARARRSYFANAGGGDR